MIEILTTIGEVVVSLDMKTMVEHWKGITKLIQQNLSILTPNLEISKQIIFLAANVSDTLSIIKKSVSISLQMTN